MKTSTAFRALTANREATRKERSTHLVFAVRKDGNLYKHPTSYHSSREEAEQEAQNLRKLNPGSDFVVRS